MNNKFRKAAKLLTEFKEDNYIFGLDCFDKLSQLVQDTGRKISVIAGGAGKEWGEDLRKEIAASLKKYGLKTAGDVIDGAKPNSPYDDVYRVANSLKEQEPDAVLAVGGGSVIDAVKGSLCIEALGEKFPELESYFGMGKLDGMLEEADATILPMTAVQLASGSGAHLTRYSNLTNMATCQKKLIIDDNLVPRKVLFDYKKTISMSAEFTKDGALDGLSHSLEVFYGSKPELMKKVQPIASLSIDLIINNVKKACESPESLVAREALGLGTDLGGYAIMVGSTNGAHLNSFSMVDILSHGRAVALLNPYYTVFFAPAVENQLRVLFDIFKEAGYASVSNSDKFKGRDLGLAVAESMMALSYDIGFPTKLNDVEGFSKEHITRALSAAKNPQLESKLKGMPVAMSSETVDDYMGPLLEAASSGDLSLIKNM